MYTMECKHLHYLKHYDIGPWCATKPTIQMQNIQNTAQNIMHYVDSFSLQQNILTKIVTETKQL